jgi:hypothetical protein
MTKDELINECKIEISNNNRLIANSSTNQFLSERFEIENFMLKWFIKKLGNLDCIDILMF